MTERIIPADRSLVIGADVEPERYPSIVSEAGVVEGVGAIKIGFEVGLGMTLRAAVEIVRETRHDLKAIYDHQKGGTDINDTGVNFARTMERGGVDAAILFPLTGPKVQTEWTKALQDKGISVIIGSEMTHPGFKESDGGRIADSQLLSIFDQAAAEGVRDFVVPGNKPERVKLYREWFEHTLGGEEFRLYAPGFVDQGGNITDAGEAAGKYWHAIVGRAICNAVRNATKKHVEQLLDERVA